MSKVLLVMRHAKSSWSDSSLTDHQRPLNKRGMRDAPRMARWLQQHESLPDIILSSTATRAITTSRVIEDSDGFTGELIEYDDLYLAPPVEYLKLLAQLNEDVTTAMVVGHNPGLEELVLYLTSEYESVPTATVVQIELGIEHWREILDSKSAKILNVWRPKEIDD